MRNLQLVDRDLILSSNKFVLVSGEDALTQQITNQITIWKNTWFADLTIGIDYIGFENKRFTDKEIISSVTQSLLLNKNITLINSISVTRNRQARSITLNIDIETIEGNLVIII